MSALLHPVSILAGVWAYLSQHSPNPSARQPAATSPSSTTKSSATTRASCTGGARSAQPKNTNRSPTTNGENSSSTSTGAKSNSATAPAHTEPAARTSTPAYAAQPCTSPRACSRASTRSRQTCTPAAAEPKQKGWLGEIEGIDLTLEFLQDKRNQAERAATFIGLPAMR